MDYRIAIENTQVGSEFLFRCLFVYDTQLIACLFLIAHPLPLPAFFPPFFWIKYQ